MEAETRKERGDGAGGRRAAGIVASAALVLYALTVCPTVPFGDGGELIAAASCLGVAHPPGYPLFTLLGWFALKAPWGEPAVRVNVLSALFGALTCGVAAWFLRRITRSDLAVIAGGLALAVSSTFWSVSVVAEVYTLHLLLLTVMLAAAWVMGQASATRERGRALVVAATALGLGLAHHPTIVLGLPAAAVLSLGADSGGGTPFERWWRRLPRVRMRHGLLALFLALVLPVTLALTLMLRARAGPASNWGRPTTPGSLIRHVTAATYRHLDLGWSGLLRSSGWSRLTDTLSEQWGWWVLIVAALGLAGLPAGPRDSGRRRARVALGLLVAAGAAFGLRYATDDVEVFYLPAILGLSLLVGLGVGQLCRHGHRAVRIGGVLLAAAVVLVPLARNLPSRNLHGVSAAADYARDILGTVPRGGVLFVEADDSFAVLYLTQVLGERPDVTIYDRNANLFRDLARDISVPGVEGESWRSRRIRMEQAFLDRELSRRDRRDVLFLGWPGYDVPPRYRMEPIGLLYRICRAQDPPWDPGPIWAGYHEQQIRKTARGLGDGFALAVAATYPLARGERALFSGNRSIAIGAFEEAQNIAKRNAGIQNYIGTLYGRMGDYQRAVESFHRALEIKPASIETWNNLAKAHLMAGDTERARAAWQHSLEIAANQPDVQEFLRQLPPD